jgi:hypothetical protein
MTLSHRTLGLTALGVVLAFGLLGNPAAEAEQQRPVTGRFCSNAGQAADRACGFAADEAYWLAIAACRNVPQPAKATACLHAAERERPEARALCREQAAARKEVCAALGESAYAPVINPGNFVRRIDHPYLPLRPGTTLLYRKRGKEGVEQVKVTVTNETETILGVPCTVVRDTVTLDGELVEDTIDWFAQDRQGNVWYFGEIARNFEDGRLADLGGSWRAGVDGAQPGIIMKAQPKVGDVYRQEFALGTAEDLARVLSLGGRAQVPAAACEDCVVTGEFTPLEPDFAERKFYARGIGLILEVDSETGERIELVAIKRSQD